MATVLKTVIGASLSRVQIPAPPPSRSGLLADEFFVEVVGVDTSMAVLARASERLALDRLPEARRSKVSLLHSSLTYRDRRLAGYDGAAVVEVVEHPDPERLGAFERAIFEFANARVVALTTPNVEYNSLFGGVQAGGFRHPDHRFEWDREDFQHWAASVGGTFGYAVTFEGIGQADPGLRAATQMAMFKR